VCCKYIRDQGRRRIRRQPADRLIYDRAAGSMSLCLLQVISPAGVMFYLGYSDIDPADYSDVILVKGILEQWYPVHKGDFILHVLHGRIICQRKRYRRYCPNFITSLTFREINDGISEKKWNLILRRLVKFRQQGKL
jgi:hypothetical protein